MGKYSQQYLKPISYRFQQRHLVQNAFCKHEEITSPENYIIIRYSITVNSWIKAHIQSVQSSQSKWCFGQIPFVIIAIVKMLFVTC